MQVHTFHLPITQEYVTGRKIIQTPWAEVNYTIVNGNANILDVKIPYHILAYTNIVKLSNDVYHAAENNAQTYLTAASTTDIFNHYPIILSL